LAQAEIDLFALEFTVLRVLYASENDTIEGLTSVLKLRGAELRQRVSELAVEILGDRGLIFQDGESIDDDRPQLRAYAPGVASEYLFNLSASIAGGTSEIQRNLIASLALGL
jgi:alkylation response protein AidB-like acyl-CoA dehydrogenase